MNNVLRIEGKITTEPKVDFQNRFGNFLAFNIDCPRKSGNIDTLKVIVKESKIPDTTKLEVGDCVSIFGEVRSYNDKEGEKKLNIFAYAQYINKIDEPKEDYENEVILIGTVCKDVTYRVTPKRREITDMLLAVNRFRKSSYLPVVVWGLNSVFVSDAEIGEKLKVKGRLQSRTFLKEGIEKTAYEISVNDILERKIKC